MISKIEIGGMKFRAWPVNEFPHLATLIIPNGTEVFEDNTVWTLFIAQNGLHGGEHSNPKMIPLNKGLRRLIIGVSKTLVEKIRAMNGK